MSHQSQNPHRTPFYQPSVGRRLEVSEPGNQVCQAPFGSPSSVEVSNCLTSLSQVPACGIWECDALYLSVHDHLQQAQL